MSYLRFGAMIATSTVIMFALMYLNTYAWEHVFYSETRTYMAIVMGATMAIVMLAFMLGMYTNRAANIAIFVGSAAVFAVALWLVRSQVTVGDVSYMRAMIPHHSIAIMTSERAKIEDPRVRKLANEIIEAQRREIAEMRYLIADLSDMDGAKAPPEIRAPAPATGSAAEAVATPVIRTMDPAPLAPSEVEEVIGAGPACRFSRSADGPPILVARPAGDGSATGVLKLNDTLVPLRAPGVPDLRALEGGMTMAADGVRMSVAPVPDDAPDATQLKADLTFALEDGLTVGYRGVLRCDS